jgi:hypothetical protein
MATVAYIIVYVISAKQVYYLSNQKIVATL